MSNNGQGLSFAFVCCCIFVIAPSIVGIIEQARKRHGDSDSNNSHVNGTLGEMPFPSNGTTGLRGSPSNSDDAWGLEEIIGIAAGVTATLVAAGFLAYNKYQQHQSHNHTQEGDPNSLTESMLEGDTEANPNNQQRPSYSDSVSKFFADIKRMCSGEAKSNDQRATEELGINNGLQ